MREARIGSKLLQLGLFALVVASNAPGRADGTTVTDAAGRSITIADASRTVSIGGAVTEILYALGQQQKIVAVDTTSLYPPRALREKPNVGYMRQLSAEGVLALAPTLILAVEGSGPKETVDVLERAKVPLVIVPDKFSGDGILEKIRLVARAVGADARGECLAAPVRADLAALETIRGHIATPVKVAFILSLADGRPVIAGRSTAADGIITLAGASNAFADFDGYKPVNDEAIVAAKPDAVLVMQRGEHALSAATVFAEPGLAMTPAAQGRTLIAMDGLYLLGFGPRTAAAARDLSHSLYPRLETETLPSERSADRDRCSR